MQTSLDIDDIGDINISIDIPLMRTLFVESIIEEYYQRQRVKETNEKSKKLNKFVEAKFSVSRNNGNT